MKSAVAIWKMWTGTVKISAQMVLPNLTTDAAGCKIPSAQRATSRCNHECKALAFQPSLLQKLPTYLDF